MRTMNYKGYTVYEDGRVIGVKGYFLKPGLSANGYYTVCICYNGIRESVCIHRLIAESFIPNPENKRTVNHINGIKTDNRIENLEWATFSENTQHAFRTGLSDRIGPAVRKQMQKTVVDTATGQQYPSATAAAASRGINQNTLRQWLLGYKPNKTTLQYLNNE